MARPAPKHTPKHPQPPRPVDLLFPLTGAPLPARDRGMVSFRPPPDVQQLVADAAANGHGPTDVLVGLSRIALDAVTVLGLNWLDVQRYALTHQVSHGMALGILAGEALSPRAR